MSLYLYDEALTKKLKNWTNDAIYSPIETRRLFEGIADMSNDAPIKLPIVCLSRRGGYSITNPNKKPLTYDGGVISRGSNYSVQLNAIPINIPYRIDVYARYLKEADAYMRDIVFNVINHSTLTVTIPYENENYEHRANIRIAGDVEDNSDIPERLISGQFYRMTLDINIDDAYLWDVKLRSTVSIDTEGIALDVTSPVDSNQSLREQIDLKIGDA